MSKIWMLRPKPHNIPRMREFLENNIIAIGWPEITSLVGKTRGEIKEALKNHPLNYSPNELGIATATVSLFVNDFRIGDIVVVPDGDNIYFCRIISEYFYDATKASQSEGYPHQHSVEWIKGPVKRDDIPEALRGSLRAPRTAADISHHNKIITEFLGLNEEQEKSELTTDEEYVVFEYPIRLDATSTIRIPKNITQTEASRLGDYVKTLYFS